MAKSVFGYDSEHCTGETLYMYLMNGMHSRKLYLVSHLLNVSYLIMWFLLSPIIFYHYVFISRTYSYGECASPAMPTKPTAY